MAYLSRSLLLDNILGGDEVPACSSLNRHKLTSQKRDVEHPDLLANTPRRLIGGDFAVADVDDAVGVFGDVRLVRDDDDGVALGV